MSQLHRRVLALLSTTTTLGRANRDRVSLVPAPGKSKRQDRDWGLSNEWIAFDSGQAWSAERQILAVGCQTDLPGVDEIGRQPSFKCPRSGRSTDQYVGCAGTCRLNPANGLPSVQPATSAQVLAQRWFAPIYDCLATGVRCLKQRGKLLHGRNPS